MLPMTKHELIGIIASNGEMLRRCKVRSVYLFGSFARNEQREDSDVDLLVDFEEPTYDNFISLVYKLEDLLAREVNVIPEGGLSPLIEPYVKKEAEKIEIE